MLVLASKSPRRSELLRAAQIPFTVRAADVEEVRAEGETPLAYVKRLAQDKAAAVELSPGEVVLGADTIVVLESEVLEKPKDASDAARMLRKLSGRAHQVLTGICLRSADRTVIDCSETSVTFLPLSESEIQSYVASGEPDGRAGAYAIQGGASRFVQRVDGCYFTVVGLPVSLVYRHLKTF